MRFKFVALVLVLALVGASCQSGGEGPRTYTADFTRAVQLFPGVKVKVLGVDVGTVTKVQNEEGAVRVTFRVDDPEVKLPADAEAVLVPMSMLGERYVQLLPSYTGGAELAAGSNIPLDRTAVPAEGDELLQAFQDYLGALDGETVEEFISNAAVVLEGKGKRLNNLIRSGTEVIATLDAKRDELANMIVQFDKVSLALQTRQEAIGSLLTNYNVVATTVVEMRSALEGTITGLNSAATQLASLMVDHRDPLGQDIRTLTRTSRTIEKNINRFARTGHHAQRLFRAAGRAVDFDRHWLRLGNQGEPLVELIMWRIQDRLIGLCMRLGLDDCSQQRYWQERFPELFCIGILECPERRNNRNRNRGDGEDGGDGTETSPPPPPDRSPEEALEDLPGEIDGILERAKRILTRDCSEAKNPKRCRKKKRQMKKLLKEHGIDLDDLGKGLDAAIDGLIKGLGGGL